MCDLLWYVWYFVKFLNGANKICADLLQDWKQKYIHPNYTRIFTENLSEEVHRTPVCQETLDYNIFLFIILHFLFWNSLIWNCQ